MKSDLQISIPGKSDKKIPSSNLVKELFKSKSSIGNHNHLAPQNMNDDEFFGQLSPSQYILESPLLNKSLIGKRVEGKLSNYSFIDISEEYSDGFVSEEE